MSKKKIILFLFFVFILSILFYTGLKYFRPNKVQNKNDPSAFSELSKTQQQNYIEAPEVSQNLYVLKTQELDSDFRDSVSSLINKRGHFIDWENENENWNWENSWFMATIKEVNQNNITIQFSMPSELKETIKVVSVDCPNEKTLVTSRYNLEVIGSHIDILKEAKPGFQIFSHCLNEECSIIGDGCVLVDMEQ